MPVPRRLGQRRGGGLPELGMAGDVGRHGWVSEAEWRETNTAAKMTLYPFYRSYRLPSAIKSSRIATPIEFM